MAVNLSVLKNPLKKALNPLGAITEQAPVTSQ